MAKRNCVFGKVQSLQQNHQDVILYRKSRPIYQSKSLSNLADLRRYYYRNYFRFEIKCGNATFVYEKKKNINRSVSR
jgi:hypothetical protein